MHVRAIIILVAMFSGSLVEHVAAQSQFFVAPLVAGPLDANLRDTESAFVLNHDGIRRRDNEPAGSTDRHYITTESSDYISTDWTYEITFHTSDNAPDDLLFIGIGEGVQDDSFFNEPRNSLNFRIHQGETGFGTDWRVDVAAHDIGFLSFPYLVTAGYLPGPGGGTHIARIRKIGNQMTFEILGTGVAATILDIAAAAPFLSNSPSRLFFGNASSGYAYNDMRVLPEALRLPQ